MRKHALWSCQWKETDTRRHASLVSGPVLHLWIIERPRQAELLQHCAESFSRRAVPRLARLLFFREAPKQSSSRALERQSFSNTAHPTRLGRIKSFNFRCQEQGPLPAARPNPTPTGVSEMRFQPQVPIDSLPKCRLLTRSRSDLLRRPAPALRRQQHVPPLPVRRGPRPKALKLLYRSADRRASCPQHSLNCGGPLAIKRSVKYQRIVKG